MKHLAAILIKAAMTFIVLYAVLGWGFGMSDGNVLLITIILGGLTYLLGDLFILPKTANIVATTTDLAMTFVVVWLLGIALTNMGIGTLALAAIISALILALCEYVFHIFILKNDLGANQADRRYKATYGQS